MLLGICISKRHAVRNDPGPHFERKSFLFPGRSTCQLHIVQPQDFVQLQPLGLELIWLVEGTVGWSIAISQLVLNVQPSPEAEYGAGQAGCPPAPGSPRPSGKKPWAIPEPCQVQKMCGASELMEGVVILTQAFSQSLPKEETLQWRLQEKWSGEGRE